MPGEDTAVYDEVDNGIEPVEAIYDEPIETEEIAESEPDETTDSVQSPFEGRSFEEVAKDPVVEQLLKSAEARLAESYRQRVANDEQRAKEYWEEEAYKERSTQADQVRQGWAERSVVALVKGALERGEEPNWTQVASIGKSLAQATAFQQNEAHNTFALDQIRKTAPDYRPSHDIVAKLDQARRTADPKALATANIQMISEAVGEYQWNYLVDKANEYIADTLKLNGAKSAAATRTSQPRPTVVGSRSASGSNYDAILTSPTATYEQRAAAFKAKNGFDLD